MKKVFSSNGFKVVAILLATMIVFCGALLLATYTAEKAAFADNDPTFYQLVKGGLRPHLSNATPWSVQEGTTLTQMDTYTLVSASSGARSLNYDFAQSAYPIVNGEHYLLCFRIRYFSAFTLLYKLPYGNAFSEQYAWSLDSPTEGLSAGYYVHFVANTSKTSIMSFSSSSSFGISNVELIPLNPLGLENVYPFDENLYTYYFGNNYHYVNTDGVPLSQVSTYTIDYLSETYYGMGYEDGYESGVDVSYDIGFAAGKEAILTQLGSNYTTSKWEFTYGDQTYLQRGDGAYVPLFREVFPLGYADFFPDMPYEQLSLLSVGCMFNADYGVSTYYSPSRPNQTGIDWNTGSYNPVGTNTYFNLTDCNFFVDQTNGNTILLQGSINNIHIPALDPFPIQIWIYEHSTQFNVRFQEIGQIDEFMQVYTLSFPPDKDYSYKFNFYLNSDNLAMMYEAGRNDANNTVNTSSASYTAGWNRGVDSASNYTFKSLISAVIDVPVKTFVSLFNFDFLGVNLLNFLLSLLTIGLIIGIVKLLI